MISYYDGQLTDLLPHNLTDSPGVQALSHALREGTRLLYRYKEICFVFCSIETMPDKVLDVLAVELRAQYYDDTMPIETKRVLVKNAILWHMTAGTPAAVEELVAAVFGNGEVTEWFEFGGEPYWFRIKTDAIITEEMTVFFSDMIKRVKNTRSHLDAVEVSREVSRTLFMFPGVCVMYEPEPIIDGYAIEREAGNKVSIGGIAGQSTEGPPIADGYDIHGDATGNTARIGAAIISDNEGVLFDGYDLNGSVRSDLNVGAAMQVQHEGILFDGYHFSSAVDEQTKVAAAIRNEHEEVLMDG